MNGEPLLSCRIKIDRTKKHFNDLIAEIEAFKARDPYKIVIDEDSEPAVKVYKIHINEPIPIEWSGHIGDIVHNLRSTLDCLAVALVIRGGHNTESILRDTYFPISWDESGLSRTKNAAFFQRVGPAVEKLIRRLQPYRRGKGHTLWRLNQLDIIDKHRRIIPAGSKMDHVQIRLPSIIPFVAGLPDTAYQGTPPFPLKEGDEVFRSAFFEAHFDAHAHFHLEIAFNEAGIVEREPVMPTLSRFINFVERLVFIFEKRFF